MLPSSLYFQIHPEFTMTLPIPSFWKVYRISLNNSRGLLLLFSHNYSREGNYFREAIILNIAHWKSSTKIIFCFIFPLNQQMITSNKLNMAFFSVPELVPWLPFIVNILCIRAWMVTDEFCHTRLQGGDLTKRRWQEGWGGGAIIWGRRLL